MGEFYGECKSFGCKKPDVEVELIAYGSGHWCQVCIDRIIKTGDENKRQKEGK